MFRREASAKDLSSSLARTESKSPRIHIVMSFVVAFYFTTNLDTR